MRLRHLVIVTCCVIMQLAAPAPAHAWWEWLDQLSGPGPFTGLDVQWRVKCIEDMRAGATHLEATNINPELTLGRFLAQLAGAGCLLEPKTNPLGSLNLSLGRMWSIHNDLRDASGTERPQVKITRIEPTLSMFVDASKYIEITSGGGVMYFSGDGFKRFHRYYWRPIAVTITPGAKAASIRLGMLVTTKGFDASDFGAVGTFHTDKEVLGTAEVTVDLARVFR
jgi:hypothetical protein